MEAAGQLRRGMVRQSHVGAQAWRRRDRGVGRSSALLQCGRRQGRRCMASSVQLGIGAFVIRPTQALAAGGRVSENCRKAVGRDRSASSDSGLGARHVRGAVQLAEANEGRTAIGCSKFQWRDMSSGMVFKACCRLATQGSGMRNRAKLTRLKRTRRPWRERDGREAKGRCGRSREAASRCADGIGGRQCVAEGIGGRRPQQDQERAEGGRLEESRLTLECEWCPRPKPVPVRVRIPRQSTRSTTCFSFSQPTFRPVLDHDCEREWLEYTRGTWSFNRHCVYTHPVLCDVDAFDFTFLPHSTRFNHVVICGCAAIFDIPIWRSTCRLYFQHHSSSRFSINHFCYEMA